MTPDVIELTEYEKTQVSPTRLATLEAEALWRLHGKKISVDWPSPKTGNNWQLQSQGYVGFIPLSQDLGIAIQPRVDVGNLFRMLEYAYRLKQIEFFEGLTDLETLPELYERLASILAKRTLDRSRKGLHRSYIPRTESLPYVRGSLDLTRRLTRPWEVRIRCDYQEHTGDIEDNQILAWTLMKIARSGVCSEKTLPIVRRAYRSLQGAASIRPFSAEACIDRLYTRLNSDYEPLHALCRFFLEHTGPGVGIGGNPMIPFLLNMPRLYELFVAEWLRQHLPTEYSLRVQERVNIGDDDDLRFDIDLVLYRTDTLKPLCVLDTKYKADNMPKTGDVQQIVAYAVSKDCRSGYLVYPARLRRPLNEIVGDIRVRSSTFSLAGDLEENGKKFLGRLIVNLATPANAVLASRSES